MKVFSFITLVSLIYSISAAGVPNIKLRTGFNMPQIGLGTWQANGPAVLQAVKDAIEIGYRHIDTASDYNNEKEVGEAIHAQINAGIVKREDLFITTKVWAGDKENHDTALTSVKNSLKKMNLTYVDLVLVHFPWGNYADIYKGLETAYEQKLSRSIGISNFNKKEVDHLLETAKVKPAVNQINLNPKNHQDETVDHCKQLNIAITGYSPLGTGSLTKNPVLVDIGKKHNKSGAQVALRWQIQRGLIVIPKSTHKAYIKEDFEIFDFELTADEMAQIHKM